MNHALPGYNGAEIRIPSSAGNELYVFSPEGRHLRTINTMTGADRYLFGYSNGLLTSITDGDGNVTTLQRNGSGTPTAIVGPYGQATTLTLNVNGLLETVTNPANEVAHFQYTTDGLMTEFTDPRNKTKQYVFDTRGYLTSAISPINATQSITRVVFEDGSYTTLKVDPLGAVTQYGVTPIDGNSPVRWVATPNGGVVTSTNALTATIQVDVRGNQTTMRYAPDPRWGMVAGYVAAATSRTPAGSAYSTMITTRTVGLSNPSDPLSLQYQLDELTVNGRTTRSNFDAINRRIVVTDYVGRVTTTTVDLQGRPLRIETSGLAPLQYSYDPSGRLQTIVDGEGAAARITGYTYDALGRLFTITDPLLGVTVFLYDAANRLTSKTLPSGHSVHFGYDAAGNLTSSTDERGVITTYQYDDANRLIASTLDPAGRAIRSEFQYDLAGNRTVVIEDAGPGRLNATSHYTYTAFDANGGYLLAQMSDPLGNLSVYDYNQAGDLIASTDPLNHTTIYSYTQQGWPSAVTTAQNLTAITLYNNDGLPQETRDPRGVTTLYSYDIHGRLKSVTGGAAAVDGAPALNQTAVFTYNVLNQMIAMHNGQGQTATRSYDLFGRVSSESNGVGNTVLYTYDALNRLIGQTTGSDNPGEAVSTAYAYDVIGRLQSTRLDPNGLNLTTRYLYTSTGSSDTWSLQGVIDPRGKSSVFRYNSLGLLDSTTDAYNQTWSFDYDNLGRTLHRTDPLGRVITYTVDLLGRNQSLNENGRLEQWQWNADGTLASYSDFANRLTSFTYDNDQRLTFINYPEGVADVTYVYDGASNVQSMVDGLGTTSYSYDALNRLSSRTRNGRTVGYSYNGSNQVTGIDYWSRGAVQYGYNNGGQLTSMTPWDTTATNYSYRSSGLLKDVQRANGVASAYGYDNAGRLTGLNHMLAGNSILNIGYGLDANGNRTTMTENGAVTSYTYDDLNRLVNVSYPEIPNVAPATSKSYAINPVGNRTQEAVAGGSTVDYGYDASDRITNPGFQYDDNGNLLSDGNATYEYDATNRLKKMTVNSVVTEFGYDGWGNLIQESSGGITTEFVIDENPTLPRILGEVRSDGTEKLYAYGPQGFAAQKHAVGPAQVEYALLDGLGSVRHLTDAAGAVTLSRSYDVYGAVRHSTGAGVTRMGFTGELQDAVTGLVYLRARHYHPVLGRFLQRDSFAGFNGRPQSLNRYAYGENNPVNFVDPSGHFAEALKKALLPWALLYGYANDDIKGAMAAFNQISQFLDLLGKLLPCDPLDMAQFLLDIMGLIPVLGEPADFINAMISLARGRYGQTAAEIAAMVPWGGWMATGTKWAGKYGDEIYDAVKYANKYGDDAKDFGKRSDGLGCPWNSFKGDTPVMTEDGSQAIETLRVGKRVLAYNVETGETGYYTVTATLVHNDPVMVYVTINGETIQTTPEHPFYVVVETPWLPLVESGRWVNAGELRVGDRVRNAEGASGVVSEVSVVVDAEVMYNLTVDQAHTFFVGDGQWLVHNSNCRMTPDQQALKDLVHELTNNGRKPLGTDDANTILDWADEINYPGWRAGLNDVSYPSNWAGRPGFPDEPHIHIPGVGSGHIPVDPGVIPR